MNASERTVDRRPADAQRTRLLFLLPSLRGGGAERVIVNLLRNLDRSRFELALTVISTAGQMYRDDVPPDVEFIDLKATRVRYAVPRMLSLIWRRRPDVVFSTLGHLNLAIALLRFALPSQVRYIARETSIVSYNLRASRFANVWTRLYTHFYPRLDFVVCQSNWMQRDLVQHFGFPSHKTAVIHNPVDVPRIQELSSQEVEHPGLRRPDTVRLVTAGRLSAEKGYDLLLDALAWTTPDVELFILGDGSQELTLKNQSVRLGISNRVHFVGFQRNPFAWFAKADAFVLSSRHEGFPNVVLEAMACGLPIIATPAPGGTVEILKSVPQCTIAEDVTSDAIARALAKWLAGPRSRVPASVLTPYAMNTIVGKYQELLS